MFAFSACGTGGEKPSGLMTEFIRHPEYVRILNNKPEFTWIIPDEAIEQTAYQIEVASSLKKINKHEADIWESGKIPGNRSAEVEFNGTDLKENTDYYWRVRIWNHLDKPTAYSSIQHFKTGNFKGYITTPNEFQTTLNRPVKRIKISEGRYFFDFGKAGFGTLEFNLEPRHTDTLIIHLGTL